MNQSYGEFLQRLRKERGLSQKDLALNLAYSPQAISKFENGSNAIPFPLLGGLCRLLKTTIGDFLKQILSKPAIVPSDLVFKPSSFAACFSWARQAKDLSQRELQNKTGIYKNKISRIETGESFPDLEEFKALADELDADYQDLYFGILPGFDYGKYELTSPRKRIRTKATILISASLLLIGVATGIGLSVGQSQPSVTLSSPAMTMAPTSEAQSETSGSTSGNTNGSAHSATSPSYKGFHIVLKI